MPFPYRKSTSRVRSGRLYESYGSPPHNASPLPDLTSSFSSGASSSSPNTPDYQHQRTASMNSSRMLTGSPRRSRSRGSQREMDNIRRGAEIIREQILAQQHSPKADEKSNYDPSWYASPLPPSSRQAQKDIMADVLALEEEMQMARLRVHPGGLDQEDHCSIVGTEQAHGAHDVKENYERKERGETNWNKRERARSSSNKRSQAYLQLDLPSFQSTSRTGSMAPPDPPESKGKEENCAQVDYASHAEFTEEGNSPISPVTDESRFGSSYLPNCLMNAREKSFSEEASAYRAGRSVPSEVDAIKDRAYMHALNAGTLWQTLVGEQIRFPSRWFGGARTPPLIGDEFSNDYRYEQNSSFGHWSYVARCRVRGNRDLNRCVRNRSKPGKILLHIIVRDALRWKPIRHIAIGCFHPNARGVRQAQEPVPRDENARDIWMGIRKCGNHLLDEDNWDDSSQWKSQLDTALTQGAQLSKIGMPSPLGSKHTVNNNNVRAVFGDTPPTETAFILESDLYKILTEAEASDDQGNRDMRDFSTVLTLLDQFVYNRLR